MTAADLLAGQLRLVHRTTALNVEGMSFDDSLVQPPGGGNCANWILGHIINVHNQLGGLLGVDPVWRDPQLKRAGPEPIIGPDNAIDWHEMVTRFAAAEERFAVALGALSAEALDEVIPTPAFGETPRGKLLETVLFHQGYHAGQLAMARRLAGHPGAIKIPGTE